MVRQNPFNVLGLLAGVSEKDIARRRAQVNAYLNVGKEISFPEDFPVSVEGLQRTSESVAKAFSQIDQYRKRAVYGLYWFNELGRVDGPAIAHLRSGDVEKAREIWGKVSASGVGSGQLISSAVNYGCLCFLEADKEQRPQLYSEGFAAYAKAFSHPEFPTFLEKISDASIAKDKEGVIEEWIESFRQTIDSAANVSGLKSQLLQAIKSLPEQDRTRYTKAFSEPLIMAIEREVFKCEAARKAAPIAALAPGMALARVGVPKLAEVKGWLSSEEFEHISDLVAEELIVCAIDHFNLNDAGDNVRWTDLRSLVDAANSTAVGSRTKNRILDNKNTLDENYRTRDERKAFLKAQVPLSQIKKELESFDQQQSGKAASPQLLVVFDLLIKEAGVVRAEGLVDRCDPLLGQLKASLGSTDALYLNVSSAVVGRAMHAIVEAINDSQRFASMPNFQLVKFQGLVAQALRVMDRLGNLNMVPELRVRFNSNHSTLKGIETSFPEVTFKASGNGCMVSLAFVGGVVTTLGYWLLKLI